MLILKIMTASLMLLGTVGFSACWSQTDATNGPQITFESRTFHFDTIPYAGNGHGVFYFENTGSDTLHILNVRSSCGCLVPSWKKEPVLPGEKGEIKFNYLTTRIGPIRRSMTVVSDAANEPRLVLRIEGYVLPRAADD